MYQGHKNKNHWNVALHINNDEHICRWALDCLAKTRTLHGAAHCLLSELQAAGITQTPDGVPYSFTTIKAALRNLK